MDSLPSSPSLARVFSNFNFFWIFSLLPSHFLAPDFCPLNEKLTVYTYNEIDINNLRVLRWPLIGLMLHQRNHCHDLEGVYFVLMKLFTDSVCHRGNIELSRIMHSECTLRSFYSGDFAISLYVTLSSLMERSSSTTTRNYARLYWMAAIYWMQY